MTGTLKKIHNGTAMRTDEIRGEAIEPPTVGHCFVMVGPPLEDGDFRLTRTSLVKDVKEVTPGHWEIHTLNSVYSFVEETLS